jgi:carbamoyltransferase
MAAAEEERFSRIKHDFGYPRNAIRFCLESAGIQGSDLDYVVYYEKPFRKFDRILMSVLQTYPQSWKVFRESMITWMIDKLWIATTIESDLGISKDRVLFCEHHLSHAASAYLCSPFDEAAILTVDGVGEWATGTMGVGRGNDIKLFRQTVFPHSLGLLYSAFTAFLGFEVNEGEYKVMGMAPYGEPRYVDKVWKLVRQNDDGSFCLNMDYFSFHHSLWGCSESLVRPNCISTPRVRASRGTSGTNPQTMGRSADAINIMRTLPPAFKELQRSCYSAWPVTCTRKPRSSASA